MLEKLSTPSAVEFISAQPSTSTDEDEEVLWFDAIDYVDMEDKHFNFTEYGEDEWFDADDNLSAENKSPSEVADERVAWTEDSARCARQFILAISNIQQNRLITAILTKIFPDLDYDKMLAVNSLYTAVTQKKDIDLAILNILGFSVSNYLAHGNAFSLLADFIRKTISEYTGWGLDKQSLNQGDAQPYDYLHLGLGILAVVVGNCITGNSSPQRKLLRLPAYFANFLVRVNCYWEQLGRMARFATPLSNISPAFAVDTSVEITKNINNNQSGEPELSAFSSNSTAYSELFRAPTLKITSESVVEGKKIFQRYCMLMLLNDLKSSMILLCY